MPATAQGVTFAVADVVPATKPLEEVAYRAAVEALLGGAIESCPARLTLNLVPCKYHAFVACVHAAFHAHRPLVLSPDHVWLLIAQGFANHVNANAEKLRKRFVSFDGQETISVRRDEFIKGAMENPWEEVFPEFTAGLRRFIGDSSDLLAPRFSTSGPVENAVCQIVLMESMKTYFHYEVMSLCGIPSITLEGRPEDWSALCDRAAALRDFDLAWWIDPLMVVLGEFRNAAAGQVNVEWWKSFYKVRGDSGGPFINGHLLKFFPYLKNAKTKLPTQRNLFPPDRPFQGVTHPSFPIGLAKAPFQWKIANGGLPEKAAVEYDMEFIGGFVGMRQNPDTLAVRPEIGWAVQ